MNQPLFVPSRDSLLEQLRLSGASDKDASAIIDTAILRARVGIYDILGTFTVQALLAVEFESEPTTDAALTRAKAALAEVLWVKAVLLIDMPTLFVDASGIVNQAWNEEGIGRDTSFVEAKEMSNRLKDEALAMLRDISSGTGSSLRAVSIGPTVTPLRPGQSVLSSGVLS